MSTLELYEMQGHRTVEGGEINRLNMLSRIHPFAPERCGMERVMMRGRTRLKT